MVRKDRGAWVGRWLSLSQHPAYHQHAMYQQDNSVYGPIPEVSSPGFRVDRVGQVLTCADF